MAKLWAFGAELGDIKSFDGKVDLMSLLPPVRFSVLVDVSPDEPNSTHLIYGAPEPTEAEAIAAMPERVRETFGDVAFKLVSITPIP
jgi:hypothetical protein